MQTVVTLIGKPNNYTVSHKKVPTFKLSLTCQILTDFQNLCTAVKCIKFATKPKRQQCNFFLNRLRGFDKVTESLKVETFLDTVNRQSKPITSYYLL